MNCDRIEQLLSRYHEGDVTDVERAAVAGHLGSCSRCRESSAAFAALEQTLVARRNELPRPGAISDAVVVRLGVRRKRAFRASRWITPAVPAIAVLAVFLPFLVRRDSLTGITGRIAAGYGAFVALFTGLPERIVSAAGGEYWILFSIYFALTVSFAIAGRIVCKHILQD